MEIIREELVLEENDIRKVWVCRLGNFDKRYIIECEDDAPIKRRPISFMDYMEMSQALEDMVK